MHNDKLVELAKALEEYENEAGIEALGQALSECLCSVAARRSADNPQIWNVDTNFVEGEVHVVFGPGASVLKRATN